MANCKGAHFQKDIILICVRRYVAYPLSYRHLEEMMEKRGISVRPFAHQPLGGEIDAGNRSNLSAS